MTMPTVTETHSTTDEINDPPFIEAEVGGVKVTFYLHTGYDGRSYAVVDVDTEDDAPVAVYVNDRAYVHPDSEALRMFGA